MASLAEETLTFFLANEEKRKDLRELFGLLAENISITVPDPIRRKIYGRTLYGVMEAKVIEKWVEENFTKLMRADNQEKILDVIWPLLIEYIHNRGFIKIDKPDILKEVTHEWIQGKSFQEILATIEYRDTKLIQGNATKVTAILNKYPSYFQKVIYQSISI